MANPRRSSFSLSGQIPISESSTTTQNPYQAQAQAQTRTQKILYTLKQFLKKPHAFPLILSALLLLTWVSLRIQFQQNPLKSVKTYVTDKDNLVNLVRFSGSKKRIMKDNRGWLLDPVSVALTNGINGGAVNCAYAHMGEIRPGSQRGNHRHHFCNETFVIWGAATLFRLENPAVERGYAQTTIGADEVAVVASHAGTAHALVNVDPTRTTFFLGCQDNTASENSSSDYKVWKDL